MKAAALLLYLAFCCAAATSHAGGVDSRAKLGELLFFDPSLSANRSQSCATCHTPGAAFTDIRANHLNRAASLGADGVSTGRRHTPTLSYVGEIPALHQEAGEYFGGFFYDGRAHTLTDQARGPIFSPLEMAQPSAVTLIARLLEQQDPYADTINHLFGADALTDPELLVRAVSESLAAFQRAPRFAPFSSKYDRYLRGEETLSRLEEHGRLLFFSTLINCHSCHQLSGDPDRETFTDYSYHNIGTPPNPRLALAAPDLGLAENPLAQEPRHHGKFRVPTLRNVAVTGPYMHNGVFTELATVLSFYNKYVMQAPANPETQSPWAEPEVPANINFDLLKQGQPLDEYRIESLVAFLKTLTDQQFEHLLD